MTRGMISCEVAQGLYLLTPESSLWIPPGVEHSIRGAGPIKTYCIYLERQFTRRLPSSCCTMIVSSFLRELILKCTELSTMETLGDNELRICRVLIDELAAAPVGNLHLPMPAGQRLKTIADFIAKNPSEKLSVDEFAQRINLSERSLARLMVDETGMSFGRWRQQLHISLALQWLAEGVTVQQISINLGYESASSFVAMFKKAMGSPPIKYITGKHSENTDLRRTQ